MSVHQFQLLQVMRHASLLCNRGMTTMTGRWLMMLTAAGVVGTVLVGVPAAGAAEPNVVTCELTGAAGTYAGTCAIPCAVNALAINIDGPRPNFSCAVPPRTVAVTLKQQARFDDWLGTMQGKEPEDPVRFGVVKPKDGKPGVAKTPYGWFPVTAAAQEGERLTLTIAADRQLPPTRDDLAIIERAIALIPSEAVWNKQDNRQCPAGQQKVSLFCAMMQATTEISGGVHYRQPAMQAVREVLNEVGGERVKLHRIMDYNNHPETTLAEIHALLGKAEAKLKARFP
jgi:very-short-patch-repair endonuclease